MHKHRKRENVKQRKVITKYRNIVKEGKSEIIKESRVVKENEKKLKYDKKRDKRIGVWNRKKEKKQKLNERKYSLEIVHKILFF